MAIFEYAIADDNNNAAGLTNIEALSAGGRRFYPPVGVGTYDPGIREYRGNLTTTFNGSASLVWTSNMLWAQYEYILSTYCDLINSAPSYSGPVTIRTRTTGSSYANYNATLILPTPVEVQRNYGMYMLVKWTFIGLAAL